MSPVDTITRTIIRLECERDRARVWKNADLVVDRQ